MAIKLHNGFKKQQLASYGLVLSVVLITIAAYIGILLISPKLPAIAYISTAPIDLNKNDDNNDTRNRIQIDKMGVEVPFFEGDETVLELGAWHRKPENGNPQAGGNFILAAHRFEIGNTPGQTRQKSPFYKIDSLDINDKIRVYYENKWYDYKVTKKIEVPATALYIENKSVEPKLTLYSCSLNGAAAGRFVIEATPVN
jgi:sortase (surface protein transpeptidase)